VHVVHDPDSDTVIVVSPDLTVRFGAGAPLWRETKTTVSALPSDEVDAIERYPAFALSIALLAAGVDGPRDQGSAELEILTPTAARVYAVPLDDGALVSRAQQRVAEIAHLWSQDVRFERRVSPACATCSVHGWCDPPDDLRGVAPAVDDREFLGFADPF
jgi:hypothetical protein